MTLIGQLKLLLLPTLRFMLFLLAVVSNDLHLMAVNSLVTIKAYTAAYLKVYVFLLAVVSNDLHLMAVNSLVTVKGSTAAYLKVYVVLVSCATHCILRQ